MSAREEHGGDPRADYERRDARPMTIAFWTALLVALVALALLVTGGLAREFARRDAAAAEPRHPMADFRQPPATAPLQASPSAELRAYEARQAELLTTYGWIDPERGVVRVPVERAIELVLERGLPVREAPGEEAR